MERLGARVAEGEGDARGGSTDGGADGDGGARRRRHSEGVQFGLERGQLGDQPNELAGADLGTPPRTVIEALSVSLAESAIEP